LHYPLLGSIVQGIAEILTNYCHYSFNKHTAPLKLDQTALYKSITIIIIIITNYIGVKILTSHQKSSSLHKTSMTSSTRSRSDGQLFSGAGTPWYAHSTLARPTTLTSAEVY